ncbi:MAG TPA: hypothetical protein VEJ84_02895 [Acidimicrobiales bacterium]|nr:hypothetical protein [Acidimicrobiales bacterium]
MSEDIEVARRLLAKLRSFVSDQLDAAEGEMFASLLAPGVSLAFAEVDDEVSGFAGEGADAPTDPDVNWGPDALAGALGSAFRESGVRVVGLKE